MPTKEQIDAILYSHGSLEEFNSALASNKDSFRYTLGGEHLSVVLEIPPILESLGNCVHLIKEDLFKEGFDGIINVQRNFLKMNIIRSGQIVEVLFLIYEGTPVKRIDK